MEGRRVNVYAYGIKPLYGGPDGKRFQQFDDGIIATWKPYAFLHYWIDDKLQYHEEEKLTGEEPKLSWTRSKFHVELRGPSDYTISSGLL
jgi:hypothetical protein